ncbi:hypothetical protein F383_19551 [Gossypium arboreum]|uniref:Uncharacterized protein n=1 Tax=Gossypium arboreum TaxID=29729 RepID=A0A0B0NNL8_GOSAR|nr:hypothetical protein F383_19551 [Gossypium arboreum]
MCYRVRLRLGHWHRLMIYV